MEYIWNTIYLILLVSLFQKYFYQSNIFWHAVTFIWVQPFSFSTCLCMLVIKQQQDYVLRPFNS